MIKKIINLFYKSKRIIIVLFYSEELTLFYSNKIKLVIILLYSEEKEWLLKNIL